MPMVSQLLVLSVSTGGWIYDERAAFDSLPSSYRCPVCNAPKRRCAAALERNCVVCKLAARLQLSPFLCVHRFKQQAPKSKGGARSGSKAGSAKAAGGALDECARPPVHSLVR